MAAMNLSFFIKGLIFGLSIAAPVGPIGILCIRRSLAGGWQAGLLTGMGAATADAVYGCMAAFGLAGVTGVLVGQQLWIQLIGGLFLCWLGLRILLSHGTTPAAAKAPGSTAGYLSALLLTLTNPMTILSFAAVFAGMGLGLNSAGPTTAAWLVAGVFSGSMAWWVILASISGRLRDGISSAVMGWINRISGLVLTAFGLVAIAGRLRIGNFIN
ncbi:lysine transporter LysE [Desulfosarcina ovata subsp. ovata]|uniref:Lysine transporter LysE n=2 Tax=Desulfosarcina ovata TaxID=83564 RepID=A0A5K8A9E9_9BACT|nr:lysine transporter LysE [Desulfosarcina ovata subsp. ovata]